MKKKVVAFAAGLGVVSSSALADDARWISVSYRDRTQTTISCGAGAMCEVTLERGERLLGGEFVGETLLSSADGAAETGQYELWNHSSMYEGEGVQQTPHLTFVASKPGLTADAVITTSRRVYRLELHSIASLRPTYVRFEYPQVVAMRPRSRPHATVDAPRTIAEQMERACATMPANERYGTDAQPAQWRPMRACHSSSRTFVQLPSSGTVPMDVPIPFLATPSGDQGVVWQYDSSSRIYGIDLVADEFVLTLGTGKHQTRMRVQRQVPPALGVTPGRSVGIAQPAPEPTSTRFFER
jgi:type IV secretory pathway VirB9-like protein